MFRIGPVQIRARARICTGPIRNMIGAREGGEETREHETGARARARALPRAQARTRHARAGCYELHPLPSMRYASTLYVILYTTYYTCCTISVAPASR